MSAVKDTVLRALGIKKSGKSETPPGSQRTSTDEPRKSTETARSSNQTLKPADPERKLSYDSATSTTGVKDNHVGSKRR
ncbi:MAG: hypothetical protein Q9162_003020 [Coniocarpon cinnabarinum]